MVFGPVAAYAQEKISLRIMRSGYPDRGKQFFGEAIPAFEKEYPNIKVTNVPAGHGGWYERIMTWVAAGKAPDIHTGKMWWLTEGIEAGAIIPLDEYVTEEFKSRFFSRGWELEKLRGNGKIYSIPCDGGAYILWYNRDLYREAGLDPDAPPKDWYEFLAYAIQITEQTGTPAVGSNCYMRHPTLDCIWPAIYHSFTGDWFLAPDSKAKFNSKRGTKALKYWVDLTLKYNVTQTNPIQYKKGDLRPMLRDGKVAMVFDGYWILDLLKEVHDFSSREKATIAPAMVPEGPATAAGRYVPDNGWVISENSKHPDEAWRLIEFLGRPEWQYKFDVMYGNVPAQPIEFTMPEYSKWYWEPVKEAVKTGFSTEYGTTKFYAFCDTFIPYLQKAMTGEMTPKEALDEAAKAVNELHGVR